MNLKQFVEQFNFYIAAGQNDLEREVQGGYCGDLLSDVMANAPIGCVWLTVQAHQNIVKVALLREMAAIVLTGGQAPDEDWTWRFVEGFQEPARPTAREWPIYRADRRCGNCVTSVRANSIFEMILSF